MPLTSISLPPRGSVRSLDDPNLQSQPFPPWLATYMANSSRLHTPKPGKCSSQVIFDYWLCRADDFANFTVRKPSRTKSAIWIGFAVSRSRGILESLPGSRKPRLPSFTRLRPSLIPASGKNLRKCCFTVRGLMLNWPAIFPIAAALHQQNKHLMVSGPHLHSNEIHHGHSSGQPESVNRFRCTCFAKPSPAMTHV